MDAGFTVKLTVKLRVVTFVPLILTVAVCVPAASPVFGLTVKLLLLFAPMLARDAADNVNRLAWAPDRDTVSAPVDWLPVLVTVVVIADCTPYPTVAAGNVCVPLLFRDMP